MKKIIIFTVVASFLFLGNSSFAAYGIQTKTSKCTINNDLPDSACTPGAVLTTNIKTICKVGYTTTVRSVSLKTAKKVFASYSIPYTQRSNYELDHLISLELGGSNDSSNLWPESYIDTNGARVKDKVENYLHKQVCSGKLSIQDAQQIISTDWLTYYSNNLLPNKKSVVNTNKPVSIPASSIVPITNNVMVPTQTNTNTNSPGSSVTAPSNTNDPAGAQAKCNDGTYNYGTNHRGACSHHGGVNYWIK